MKNITPRLFTPVDRKTGIRLKLYITTNLDVVPRGRRWTRTVQDVKTGKRYRAWDKSCGLRCHCDAYAEEITE